MEKLDFLEKVRNEAINLDCDLKDIATNLVFSDGNCNSKIMLLGEALVQGKILRANHLWVKRDNS